MANPLLSMGEDFEHQRDGQMTVPLMLDHPKGD